MLGAAAALRMAHQEGLILRAQPRAAVVLRNDNDANCRAVNTWRSDSLVILEALGIILQVAKAANVKIRLRHIPGEQNRIADRSSRRKWSEAAAEANSIWGEARLVDPTGEMDIGIDALLRVAQRSKRTDSTERM